MVEIFVGLRFIDNLWDGDEGEVIERITAERWTVRWRTGLNEYTSETTTTINDMIEG
jgi:hypothetical protein